MNARIPGQPAASGDSPTPADLLDLILEQRAALSGADTAAATRLEQVTDRLATALHAFTPRPGRSHATGLDAATASRLQAELRINQELLARVNHQNRQGLNLLFGEPDLYSR